MYDTKQPGVLEFRHVRLRLPEPPRLRLRPQRRRLVLRHRLRPGQRRVVELRHVRLRNLGRVDFYARVQNDDGSSSVTDYDQGNAASWNSATYGLRTWAASTSTPGSRTTTARPPSPITTRATPRRGTPQRTATITWAASTTPRRPERRRLVLRHGLRPGQRRVVELRHVRLRNLGRVDSTPGSRTTTARPPSPITTRPTPRRGTPPRTATTTWAASTTSPGSRTTTARPPSPITTRATARPGNPPRAGYDSLSRLDYLSVQNDNGSFYWTDYDQANGASWKSATAGYDSLSRLDTYSVQNDNGSFSWTDYDQANGASWNSATAGYDSLSRLDTYSVQNDNGSFSWTDYDQANGASWNSVTYGQRQPEPPRLHSPSRTTTARPRGPTTTRPTARPGIPSRTATTT